MTKQKRLKQLIRARMEQTGERYAAARRQVIRHTDPAPASTAPAYRPGSVPATSALRALLGHAGIANPQTGRPFTEAMLFGIAGGIGMGVFSFFYQKEDIATFFIAGRHQWHDDQAYLSDALARLGSAAIIQESGGARAADAQIRAALQAHGPCIAWVDLAGLPHRAMPAGMSGSGYHVVTVYQIDDQAGTALIGDLSDQPITIAVQDLAQARARIKKFRQRILSLSEAAPPPPLPELVRAGLRACYERLLHPTLPSPANARLEALETWAERLYGSQGQERWERVYRPGPNLLRGLSAVHDFIEHYGTGGGLCRPIFADFLSEAAEALGHPPLAELAERYAALGAMWSALADAALPDDVGMLREAKQLLTRKAELLDAGAPAAEIREVWRRLAALEEESRIQPPLSDAVYADLRRLLGERVAALYAHEVAAHARIPGAVPT
jgi:hypothetical protein